MERMGGLVTTTPRAARTGLTLDPSIDAARLGIA